MQNEDSNNQTIGASSSSSRPSSGLASIGSHWAGHWGDQGAASKNNRSPRAVWAGRIIFITLLAAVATVLGYVTFHLLTTAEENLAQTQFESISSRALVEAEAIAHRRRWAGVTMAAMISELYPNASQWPFVELLGFERLARGILNTSSGVDMGFAPALDDPEEWPAFEEFAYDVYRKMGWPNGTGYSSFGRGIWGQEPNGTAPDKRYHDTTGDTTYNSPYRIVTPIFRTDEGPHRVLMFNTHSGKSQGQAIDRMMTCSLKRKEGYEQWRTSATPEESKCGVITDIFPIVKQNGRWGAALLRPVYPVNDPFEFTGYVSTLFLVDELLQNVFSRETRGIDAVFATSGNRSVTFTIVNGEAIFVGEGDHHDTKYDKYRQTVELLDNSLYTEDSPGFWFSLSPNGDFEKVYETNNPAIATTVTVCIILLTSFAFFFYDFCVRREFDARKALLDARRQFMRFVSHEVRTPLNSVAMGLHLLQSDLAKVLGFDSPTCLRAHEDFAAAIEGAKGEFVPTSKFKNPDKKDNSFSSSECQRKALEWFRLSQEIEVNTQGAVDILNDLLNYDKIERGTLRLQLDVILVWSLIEKVILEFKLPCSSKNIHFGLSFAVQDPARCSFFSRAKELPVEVQQLSLIGDYVRLTQVFRNLMSNALKFTPDEGNIHVKAFYVPSERMHEPLEKSLDNGKTVIATYQGKLQISVEDTGFGMSPDQLNKLFRDGVQFNANELQAGGGSGLGLFIAQGIVKQHRGSLSAASDGLGKGTTFSLSLPLWRIPEYNAGKLGRTKDSAVENYVDFGESELHPLRILVVDDVLSNRKLLRRLLETKGHQCDEAENGRIAVDMVQSAAAVGRPYGSVLMDYEMPLLNGPLAAKEIRRLGFDVNIIGVTGNVLPEDVSHFMSCGANQVVTKPVRIAELNTLWLEYGVYEQSIEESWDQDLSAIP